MMATKRAGIPTTTGIPASTTADYRGNFGLMRIGPLRPRRARSSSHWRSAACGGGWAGGRARAWLSSENFSLLAARCRALLTGSTTVGESHLKNTTLSDGALAKIFSEIVEGEEWFFQQSEAYAEQLQQMRAPKTLTKTSDPNSKKVAGNGPRKGRIPKPGNRNPNRDEIGRQQHASTAPH